MEISQAVAFAELVRWEADGAERWIAQPDVTVGDEYQSRLAAHLRKLIVAIGPEGGFTEEEVRAALDAGWQPLDLGARILRVETAAVAVAAWVALASTEDQP